MKPEPADVLSRSRLLRFLPEDQLDEVRALFRAERYEFGEPIVRQGEEADAFFVVTSGRARVVKENERGEEIVLASLRPGDEFGEGALLSGGVRTATVRCSTSVEVLRLDREDFQALAARYPEFESHLEAVSRYRTLHSFLYEYSNFGRLPVRALRALVEKLRPEEVRRGAVLLRQGDPPGPMYIMRKGRARATASVDGKLRNLAFYREGDFFGELSVLNDSPRSATVEAVSDCSLLSLSPEAVRDLRRRFPEFARLMEERLAMYRADVEARVPLDFAVELLPAEAGLHDKVALDEPEVGEETPFEDERGRFRKRGRRIRRFPVVRQIDEADCGAAALAGICRYWGRKVSLARIRELCHTASDGTSLKALVHAATELGLAARAVKVSRRSLSAMPVPAIVHWEGNHWVVLFDVDEAHVRVADPALGIRRLPRQEFERRWTGYAALFDYTTTFEQTPEERPVLGRLLPFLRPHRTVLAQALVLAAAVGFLELLFPVFTQVVVDRVIVEQDLGLLRVVLLGMAAAILFTVLAGLVQQYLIAFAAIRIDTAMLDHAARQLLSLPMSFFSSRRTGDIQRRLDGALQIREFAVRDGIGALLATIELAGSIVLMSFYNLILTGVFLVMLPVYALMMLVSFRILRPRLAELEDSQGRYLSHQIDAIKGIEAVKAGAAEPLFRSAMLNQFLSVSRKRFQTTFIVMSYESALRAIELVSIALFLGFGAHLVVAGRLTIGTFVAFSSLTLMAHGAILRTLGVWDQFQLVAVLLNRLRDILEQEPEQGADRSRLLPVPTLEGHLELRNLRFRYGGPESPEILKGIGLVIPPGGTVALVGRSGCGKTTLVKLLAGLLEPTGGTILYDHLDLKALNYRDLRRQIGMVLQENHIFDGTVMQNISFGDPQADFDRVLWASQLAAAHDFVMRLPLGYETRIGESGLSLSGGQRQRISIARAVYHNPPILIFDEATSSLDTESERAIQNNLEQMMAGRTCIVVAHRLSTVRDADLIVVLEAGEVAETGTHDELMARRGLYFYLCSQQIGI